MISPCSPLFLATYCILPVTLSPFLPSDVASLVFLPRFVIIPITLLLTLTILLPFSPPPPPSNSPLLLLLPGTSLHPFSPIPLVSSPHHPHHVVSLPHNTFSFLSPPSSPLQSPPSLPQVSQSRIISSFSRRSPIYAAANPGSKTKVG